MLANMYTDKSNVGREGILKLLMMGALGRTKNVEHHQVFAEIRQVFETKAARKYKSTQQKAASRKRKAEKQAAYIANVLKRKKMQPAS